jgi:DNA-binding PadR family transcriptional regulator
MNTTTSPEHMLPLTPACFHIMLALVDGELHGYAIMQAVDQLTGGQMKLVPGTLYRSIKKLLDDGLIIEVDERPDPALDDERRRYYRLTHFGQRVAAAEVRRLSQLVNMQQARKLVEGT